MTKLEEILYKFRSELGGDFISTDVVGMDGISIAGGSLDPNFDANNIAARFAEVMKLALKISAKIDIGKVDDNLVTTDKTYIISRFLGDTTYYWVAVVSINATLGSLRMLMNEYAPQILEAIPHATGSSPAGIPVEIVSEPTLKEEKNKENKPKRNIWADAIPKEKKNSSEDDGKDSLKTFSYP
jgi:predicted regulator of Ras-like GTPase activity (Roadblock/LC7/MglB family)